LLASFGWGAVAAYTAAMALITVISVVLASETYMGDLTATHTQERQLISEGGGK
jgi:hypothetical protein